MKQLLVGSGQDSRRTEVYKPKPEEEEVIVESIRTWREAYPLARYANIYGRKDVCDDDFACFRGLHTLRMETCDQPTITSEAFKNLAGTIAELYMYRCNQPTITDEIFQYIKGVSILNISGCTQLTGEGLRSLGHRLNVIYVAGCNHDVKVAAKEMADNCIGADDVKAGSSLTACLG